MSANPERPLYAVPDPSDDRRRWAWALHLKRWAGRVLSAMRAAPAKAAAYAGRLVDALHLHHAMTTGTSAFRRAASATAGVVRRVGPVPLASAVLTSSTGQRALRAAARKLGQGLRWVGTKLAGIARRALGYLGKPSERLVERARVLSGRVAEAVARQARRLRVITGLVDFRIVLRLINRVASGIVVHRLLGAVAGARLLLVLLEALLTFGLIGSRYAWPRRAPRRPAPWRTDAWATAGHPGAASEWTPTPSAPVAEPAGADPTAKQSSDPGTEVQHADVHQPVEGAGPQEAEPQQAGIPPADADADGLGVDDLDGSAEELPPPRNRAERRLRQQAEARARRQAGRRKPKA